jgi:hypothetical protein
MPHFQCRTLGLSVTSPKYSNLMIALVLRCSSLVEFLAKMAVGKNLGKIWFA